MSPLTYANAILPTSFSQPPRIPSRYCYTTEETLTESNSNDPASFPPPTPLSFSSNFECHISFVLYVPEKKKKITNWVPVRQQKNIFVTFDPIMMQWDGFKSLIENKCKKNIHSIGNLILDGSNSNPTKIHWFGYIIKSKVFNKTSPAQLKDDLSFLSWLDEVAKFPTCRGGINLKMVNPREEAANTKKAKLVAHQCHIMNAHQAKQSSSIQGHGENLLNSGSEDSGPNFSSGQGSHEFNFFPSTN